MSSKRRQDDGGCVTVEYSTEEKRELYDVGTGSEQDDSEGRTEVADGDPIVRLVREILSDADDPE